MQVLTIVGNRPQFVKAAAISQLLRREAEEVLVHTGQHYDDNLSRAFFDDLQIPEPDHFLGIGGGSNTAQVAQMLTAIEPLMNRHRPDFVLLYGDTNTTLAGALAAVNAKVPIAHVEAGMRSFDRSMPEETNRVLVDHVSTLFLCSSQTAADNLNREGIREGVHVCGDVMVDVAEWVRPRLADNGHLRDSLELPTKDFVLVTAHRGGNVDDPERLAQLVSLLKQLPKQVVFPLHPRTKMRLEQSGLMKELDSAEHVNVLPPLGYIDFMSLVFSAGWVFTDSGGVQKEAYIAGVPCVTLRATTEWTETLNSGWNVLVDLNPEKAIERLGVARPIHHPPLYGDGHAGARIVAALTNF